ncbi:PD-(D/E)XK nuclease family protein [Geofilum sp. OHC36d9]|uniref:PD-(D/E)XK nuclease family protein n=1 Tax=Geofilum sp. OHC36d9 TaxID=3458413 RepID=UPI004033C19A
MQTFLEKLADYYIKNNLTEINDFCFVFPSRRAGLFFTKALAERINRPMWSPEVLTISDFFHQLNPTPVSDTITLLFKLHLNYCEVMPSDVTIDEFLPIGEMLLNDFNDIDKYLADADQVFSNLAAIKAMEGDFSHLSKEQIDAIRTFWESFNPEKLSEQQTSFLSLWEKLPTLYHQYRKNLQDEGLAYQGMVSRSVAESIRSERAIIIPWKRVVFAGFNALNNCEKVVFHYLNLQGKASFFWDYPQWIVPQPNDSPVKIKADHEAWRFLQYNLANYPSPRDWDAPFNPDYPTITISAASNELVQAAIANHFLEASEPDGANGEKTGLILADEQQLLPVLHAIPEKYKAINITLGYPLKNTPAFALVDAILAMQKTTRRTKEGKTWFYHREVMAVLRHQYMNTLLKGRSNELIQRLNKSRQIFIIGDQLQSDELLKSIFQKIETTPELTNYLNKILTQIYLKLAEDDNNKVEKEFIYFLITAIKRLSDLLSELPQVPSAATWQQLFRQIATQQTVPFKGEPLSGLQVMGILETRLLDFQNLIILGLNEGTFPKTTPPVSFIPYNIRKGFDLPTIDNQDSIFAYYFYRLLHRAKKIHLVYTTNQALTEENEMSRFLQQLYYEYPGQVEMQTLLQEVTIPATPKIEASKNAEVMTQLNQWLLPEGRSLSPSALTMYLTCPLKFYYKYIAGIKEADEISEDLDPRMFGNLFHQIVEALYRPFIGQTIEKQDLEQLLKDHNHLRSIMDKIFAENIQSEGDSKHLFTDLQGKISLVYSIIQNYVTQFLKQEMKSAPFQLLGLEEKVEYRLKLSNNIEVNIGGTIDRTDRQKGIMRIIDYKTGKAGKTMNNVEQLFTQKDHDDKKAIFQTLLYALVKSKITGEKEIEPGVIAVKELHAKDYNTQIYLTHGRTKETLTLDKVINEYQNYLDETLQELFNPAVSFRQTENAKSCEICTFKQHCLKN